jgi:hypothetical protein
MPRGSLVCQVHRISGLSPFFLYLKIVFHKLAQIDCKGLFCREWRQEWAHPNVANPNRPKSLRSRHVLGGEFYQTCVLISLNCESNTSSEIEF